MQLLLLGHASIMGMEIGFEDARNEGLDFDATVVEVVDIDEGFASRDLVGRALLTLPPREERVLRLYFGLGGIAPMTVSEIGTQFGISASRADQLLQKGLYRMRHRFFMARLIKDRPERPPYLDGAARWREDNRDRRLARDRERDAERLERARAFSREAQSAAVEREERVAETAARCEAERFAEYQRQVRDARAIRAVQSAAQEVGNPDLRESGPGSAKGWLRRLMDTFGRSEKVS